MKQKKKIYKEEIKIAKKLKHDGILIPLAQNDQGCIYTDDIHDIDTLIELAKLQSWTKKCFWVNFQLKETKIILL